MCSFIAHRQEAVSRAWRGSVFVPPPPVPWQVSGETGCDPAAEDGRGRALHFFNYGFVASLAVFLWPMFYVLCENLLRLFLLITGKSWCKTIDGAKCFKPTIHWMDISFFFLFRSSSKYFTAFVEFIFNFFSYNRNVYRRNVFRYNIGKKSQVLHWTDVYIFKKEKCAWWVSSLGVLGPTDKNAGFSPSK